MAAAKKKRHVLAILRKHLSITQDQLAEWCGCSLGTIQSIEIGRLALSERLAERISVFTGAPVEWLLENNPNSAIPNLDRRKAEKRGKNIGSRLIKSYILESTIRTLLAIDLNHDVRSLALLLFYTTQYGRSVKKVLGEYPEFGPFLEMKSYLERQIDMLGSVSHEDVKWYRDFTNAALNDASTPAPETKPRRRQKATRRIPASA